MDRVAAKEICHHRLQGHDLEVNADVPVQDALEQFFLDYLDNMRLPCAWSTVRKPPKRLSELRSTPARFGSELTDHTVRHLFDGVILLRIAH